MSLEQRNIIMIKNNDVWLQIKIKEHAKTEI